MRLLASLSLALVAACTPAVAPPAAVPASAERPEPEPAAGQRELAALSSREQGFESELRADVTELAGKIGERNPDKKWELAGAADWLAGALESAGYGVGRQGYEIDGIAAQNLSAEVRGARAADEIVVVGAHYDSAAGSPGADDDASGVAAALALARRFKSATPERTLRFVFFALEEPPYFQTENMTSLRYAKAAEHAGEHIVAMLSLESIGVFSDAPDTQRYPPELAKSLPRTGSFIAVVGNDASKALVELVTAGMRQRSSIPVEGATLSEDLPAAGASDHWSFWQIKAPAVMITDTAPYRYAHYHKPTDTPDRLDFARMARVVAGLESVLGELVGDALSPLPNRERIELPSRH